MQYVWGKICRNYIQYFLPLLLFSLCEILLTVFVLCVLLSSYVYLLYSVYIAVFLQIPDCWLEASIRKFLRPATSTQVFLGFPVSIKRMLRWFPSFQVATTFFSRSPPDLNFLVTFFSYLCTCKITTATG